MIIVLALHPIGRARGRARILIINDSPTAPIKFSHLLKQQGYKTTIAEAAENAATLTILRDCEVDVIQGYV